MIWENKVQLLIMLCPLKNDKDKDKQEECINYWGVENEGQSTNSSFMENFKITLVRKVDINENIILRQLELTMNIHS